MEMNPEKDRFYCSLFESMPQSLLVFDSSGTVIACNSGWERMSGYVEKDIIGKHFTELTNMVTTNQMPDLIDRFNALIHEKQSFDFEHTAITKQGSKRWYQTHISPTLQNGDIAGFQALSLDITQHKNEQEALKRSEEWFRLALDSADAGTWEWDLETDKNVWSERLWHLYGIKPNSCEPSFDSWAATVHHEDLPGILRELGGIVKSAKEINIKWRVKNSGEPPRWLLSRGRPIFDESGQPVKYIGTVIDISSQTHLQLELEKQRQILATIFDASPAQIYFKDIADRYIAVNDTFVKQTGLSKIKVEGSTALELFPDIADAFQSQDQEIVKTGRPITGIVERISVDDKFLWLRTDKIPFKDQAGNIQGVIGFSLDITALKQAEEKDRLVQERLLRQYEILTEMAFSPALTNGELKQLAQTATESVSKAFGIARVSIWLLDDDTQDLCCIDLFAGESGDHQSGAKLTAEKYQNEYEYLKKFKFVDASEPLTDPRTAGYVEDYLKPHGITAMLDGAILVRGRPIGTVCLEHVSRKHTWTNDEISFVCQLADHIGLAVMNKERKEYILELRKNEQNLQTLFNAINESVCLFDRNGLIIAANDTFARRLGKTVAECVGGSVYAPIPQELAAQRRIVVERVLSTGMPASFEDERNGLWLYHNLWPVLNEAGEVDRIVVYAMDLTARKQFEQALIQSEEQFRAMFENHAAVMLLIDPEDGRILRSNRAAEKYYGYTKQQFQHLTIFQINQTDPRQVGSAMNECVSTRRNRFYFKHKMANQAIRDVEVHSSPIPFRGKNILFSIVYDITERKLVEEELRLKSLVLEQIKDHVTITDLDGRISYVNKVQTQVLGYTKDELIGKTPDVFGDDASKGATQREILTKTLCDGKWRGEVVNYSSDGQEIVMDCRTQLVFDAKGEAVALCGIATDITQRKHMEIELRHSEEKYRLIVDTANEGIWSMDADHVTTYVNQAMANMLGYSTSEMLGRKVEEFFYPQDMTMHEQHMSVRHKGNDEVYERRFKRKDGTELWTLVSAKALMDDEGKFSGSFAMFTDITEIKRTANDLMKIQSDYKTLFEQMLNGFALHEIICDSNGKPIDYRFLAVNPAFETMTGLKGDEIIGKTVLEIMPSTERYWIDLYGSVALTGCPRSFNNYSSALNKYYEGTAFCPAPKQFACIFSDITQRVLQEKENEKLQKHLFQSQKMDAVGQLAGGMAHDFNNMLGIIIGYSSMLLGDMRQEDEGHEEISVILESANRAKDLSMKLLTLARKEKLNVMPVPVKLVVDDLVAILNRTLPKKIQISINVRNNSSIAIDKNQFHQALLNICLNARDAMPEGGVLFIDADVRNVIDSPTLRPGNYCEISISDTGVGIPKEIQEKIFEPFFTTKGVGKGTGLGLSSAHGILVNHGGGIHVYSESGRGVKRRVELTPWRRPF